MTTLERIIDNIYHVDSDPVIPPLYVFLTDTYTYFELGTATAPDVELVYTQFIPLILDLRNSYDYSSGGLKVLIQNNIDSINALGLGTFGLTEDLEHLLLIIDQYENVVSYESQLLIVLRYFSLHKSEFPEFLLRLRSSDLDKSNLLDILFSKAIILTEESDRTLFDLILDTLDVPDYLYSVKPLYKEVLEVKQATTSTDLTLATLDLLVTTLISVLTDLIYAVKAYDDSLVTKITISGKSVSYDNLISADNLFTPQEYKNSIITNGYTVVYVINNAAQNFKVDYRTISTNLILNNHELELRMNTLTTLFNANLVYLSVMSNYTSVESEVNTQLGYKSDLDSLNTQVDAQTTLILAQDPINEALLLNIGNQEDNIINGSMKSTSNINALASNTYQLGQQQQQINDQSLKSSPSLSSLLDSKFGSTESLLSLTSALLLSSQSDLQSLADTLLDTITKNKALMLAISLHNDPNETVHSLFNLLAVPIEAALIAVNTVICVLKALQCFLCIVKAGIIKAAGKLVDLYNKVLDVLNSDTDYMGIITDLKNKIVDAWDSIMEGSICSEVQSQKAIDNDAVRTALAGTGLNDNAGSTALSDKQEIFNNVINNRCTQHFLDMIESARNVISTQFDAFVDEIKLSVENTLDNLNSLVNGGCSTCPSVDLPKLGGANFPKIKGIDFSLPDFVLKIPYLDSKVIKC